MFMPCSMNTNPSYEPINIPPNDTHTYQTIISGPTRERLMYTTSTSETYCEPQPNNQPNQSKTYFNLNDEGYLEPMLVLETQNINSHQYTELSLTTTADQQVSLHKPL